MQTKKWGWVLATIVLATGCAAGLAGRWKGTGEVGEGRFFELALDLRNAGHPVARVQYQGAEQASVPVCGLQLTEKNARFQLDVDGHAGSCPEARAPLTFAGSWGQDVLTGDVLDGGGQRVGIFRAFRVPE
jgi:hypothetical protein